jgi:hypothetical protein
MPVRLPDLSGRFWMIVITGLREDMVLLVNYKIKKPKQSERIILSFLRWWGIEIFHSYCYRMLAFVVGLHFFVQRPSTRFFFYRPESLYLSFIRFNHQSYS